MGNKSRKKSESERDDSENKGIISGEFFFAEHFRRTLLKKRSEQAKKYKRTSCKAMCIIIMKVFKQDLRKTEKIKRAKYKLCWVESEEYNHT